MDGVIVKVVNYELVNFTGIYAYQILSSERFNGGRAVGVDRMLYEE